MSGEPIEDAPPQPEAALEAPRGGRLRVALIAALLLAVIGAGALLSGGAPETPTSAADASATLESALAAGEPVYVLIHSLT